MFIPTPNGNPFYLPNNYGEKTCPECGKPEKKVEVCAHCGYKYPEESYPVTEGIKIIVFVIFVIWIIMTLFSWFINSDHTTLIEVLKSQLNFIKGLKLWK